MGLLLLASCSTQSPDKKTPAVAHHVEDTSSLAPELPNKLSLAVALDYAWRNHPGMLNVRAQLEASKHSRLVATLWPNPVVVKLTNVEIIK